MRGGVLVLLVATAALLGSGCVSYGARHEVLWDARDQIWRADRSAVRVRAAQSRVYEDVERPAALAAVLAAFQDVGFEVEVLDPALGIVSGKKFGAWNRPARSRDVTYYLYEAESLLPFSRRFRTWGPFWHRSDLVRLTVTVRRRGTSQLVVRAAAQARVRAVEDPEPYQKFFRTLERALFLEREAARTARAGAPRG